MRRPTLPISLYVANQTAVVVTDGHSGTERAARLREAGAIVREVQCTDYTDAMLNGAVMVIAQTNNAARDAEIVTQARKHHSMLCYAHDQPSLSDFAMPALMAHGPLKVAVSTDAVAPALARRLREQLQLAFAPAKKQLLSLLEKLATRRNEMPSGRKRNEQLYALASRLRLKGHITITDENPPDPQAK